jgi:CRISPR/Cas system-associated exonuclease Cas4 (RecB family)
MEATKKHKNYLSKSDFLKYQTCPQYLWLWKNKRDVVPQDNPEDVEHRLEQGNEVESYARLLFPEGVLVENRFRKAKYDTERFIKEGKKVIFQGTVVTDDNLLAMADVLVLDEMTGKWTIYEVKSTTEIKKEHILDTAFQKAAFRRGGYDIDHVEIIYLNKEYKRHGKIEPNKLFVFKNVDERIEEIIEDVTLQLDDALEYINKEEEPVTCSCRTKTRSQHCPTFQYLNPDVPEYSVFNLTRVSNKKLGILVDMEIYHIHEIPDDFELTENQKNQTLATKLGKPIIFHNEIKDKLDKLTFPLYFLDYETISTAIPMFDGCKPYQQVPFQYSLHIMNHFDDSENELIHTEFLAKKEDGNPMPKLLEQMKKDIGPVGSVIVWNQSFEMARNKEMAEMYPEYADFLLDVNARVYDLMEIFSKQLHVHPEFLGKTSIKYVLPVLVPELSYKDLEIQNGSMACLRWYEMATKKLTEKEINAIYDNLLVYCGLDTMAMYKIYEHLLVL